MAESKEKRMLIAMDGSKYADYAFDCECFLVHVFISFSDTTLTAVLYMYYLFAVEISSHDLV